MKLTLLCVGKLKEAYWKDALSEYVKRLSRYGKTEIVEAADERTTENAPAAEDLRVINEEGQRLLSKIPKGSYVIALAIDGEAFDSVGMAERIRALGNSGKSQLVFIIGGSLGLSQEVLSRADERWSFSRLTFPHQMMRVILAEQLYRSFRIINNEPYHK
ncbi:MAG: 23S rRNA (pseudouridine(1915)-N(3))-methyltransferase RlmH [Lachnospiraceae bacterium]|nr:23S rRNA (pseudouridine(1915)-N(3))-methyltransferase RlmH [Lachnospiraceae bacterium]